MHQIDTQTPASRTVVTHDADELACKLSGWQQRYDQISCGSFHGALDDVRLPEMQVFHETINQSVRQSCRVWAGALWFGFSEQQENARINGRVTTANTVMLHPGDAEFELMTPSAHAIYGAVVTEQLLRREAARSGCQIDWDALHGGEMLHAAPAARSQCLAAMAALLAAPAGAPQDQAGQDLTDALLVLLDQGRVEAGAAASWQRRQRIVARVRDYILAHRGRAITVPELCALAHVSRRTLQYAFEDVLGISPTLYLRRLRLNGVRRQLLQQGGAAAPIGDIAADWGFDNFSQFSCDYRKLFGHSASGALKAKAAR